MVLSGFQCCHKKRHIFLGVVIKLKSAAPRHINAFQIGQMYLLHPLKEGGGVSHTFYLSGMRQSRVVVVFNSIICAQPLVTLLALLKQNEVKQNRATVSVNLFKFFFKTKIDHKRKLYNLVTRVHAQSSHVKFVLK